MKKSNLYLIKYELKNNLYNGYSFFFGAIFPMMLLILISRSITSDVPAFVQAKIITGLFLTMSMIVPLASVFLGYAASYANEREKNIPQRLNLYGIKQSRLFTSKLIANYLFLTFCLLVYCLSLFLVKIETPHIIPLLVWILVLYVFSAFLLALAHGIANMIKSFGPTYGVVMGIYFVIMILSGMMGVSIDNLPKFIQPISHLLPTSQFNKEFVKYWMGGSYNFVPLIKSMLFFGAISFIILLISFKVGSRKN